MFEINNLTDFEKLLFAEKHIKELQQEIKELKIEKGILHSDIDELKYTFRKENPDAAKLLTYKKEMKATRVISRRYQVLYERTSNELLRLKNGYVTPQD